MRIRNGIVRRVFSRRKLPTVELNAIIENGFDGEKFPLLVYLGNGASNQSYAEIFKKKRINGGEFIRGTGSNIFASWVRLGNETAGSILINGFSHRDAVFKGFYARIRRRDTWYWFTERGEWKQAGDLTDRKYLFHEGEDVRHIFGEDCDMVFFQAQWKHAFVDETVNCGYHMFSNSLMAHALGGFEGKTYCNTLDAFWNGVKNGYKYFEVDLSYTSDERLVLCHGWTESNCRHTGFQYSPDFADMTYNRIMGMSVHGHAISDARDFYDIVRQNPEYTFEVDFHPVSGQPARKRILSLLEDFQYDTEALDRLLIQVYSRDMYFAVDEVYHFKHYQYLVGKNITALDDIIGFCLDHGICALAMRDNLSKPSLIRKIRNAELYVLSYTVNTDISVAHKLLDSGVNTLCTDFIVPYQLRDGKNEFGNYPFYIYYHSGEQEVEEDYSRLIHNGTLQGNIVRTPKGAFEFRNSLRWKNDGTQRLIANQFRMNGSEFVGWKLRVRSDNKVLWYGTDHCYHTGGDFVSMSDLKHYIFKDEEILPVWTVKENMKLVMVAVWKQIEIVT